MKVKTVDDFIWAQKLLNSGNSVITRKHCTATKVISTLSWIPSIKGDFNVFYEHESNTLLVEK